MELVNQVFFKMEIDLLGLDTNNHEVIDTWETADNNKLLLTIGTYSLEYLANKQ